MIAPLLPILYEDVVRNALKEDLGRAGDLTSDAIIGDERAVGSVVVRKPGRVAGLEVGLSAFRLIDPSLQLEVRHADGSDVDGGTVIAEVRGSARSILIAERVALNFLGQLSGVATATRELVRKVGTHKAQIACTRKTTPGLRALEKYAVRVGGGSNHRFGLDDAVLIKDNHREIAGGVAESIRRAKASVGHMHKIEVEVENLDQLRDALEEGIGAVLLDNMSIEELAEAVGIVDGRCITEASGGITPETVGAVAATGVDLISVGWITHSAPALDVSLDVVLGR